MMPVLLLCYIFLIEKGEKRYPLILPFFFIIGIYMFVRQSLGITETYPWRSVSEHILGFLTFLRACLTYLRLLVWPVDLHFDRAQEMFLTFRDPQLWATIVLYITSGTFLLKYRKRLTKPLLFFMAWVCIELFPVSQMITTIGVRPGYISAAEHFLYMPIIGAFVLLVFAVRKLYRFVQEKGTCSVNVCRFAVVGVLLFFMLITVRQSFDARSALTMFRRSLEYNPNNTRILYSMGIEMANRKNYEEAEQYFRKALAGEPHHLISRIALGRALYDQEKYVEAVNVYETIKDAGQWDQLLEKNLNEAYQIIIEQYQQWIVESPGNAQLHNSLGVYYLRSKLTEKGIEQYKLAVAIDPVYKNALFNLASSYEALGELGWAVAYYERLVALNAEKDYLDRYAYEHLGKIYKSQGETQKAQEYFNKASIRGYLFSPFSIKKI